MVLDNEQQRKFLLEMIQQVNFPGAVLELAFGVKQAILQAETAPEASHHRDYAHAVPLASSSPRSSAAASA